MATAHQLSIVTNSCVKPPTNPKSGLPNTLSDRNLADRNEIWHGRDADFLEGPIDLTEFQASRSYNFDSTNTLMETAIPDLSQLTDEEFYQRLVDLRTEHKKTLEMCENLYQEKLRETVREGEGDTDSRPPLPVASVDMDYTMSTKQQNYPLSHSLDFSKDATRSLDRRDKLCEMSFSKPPTGKPRESRGTPGRSATTKSRHAQASPGGSLEDRYWKTVSASSTEVDCSLYNSPSTKKRVSSPVLNGREGSDSHIDRMWENFSIDDYAPRSGRQRSNSFSGTSVRSEADENWQHRVTIPQPFRMTIREQNKIKKKSQNIEEYERRKEQELRREEEECQKKFKAKPVPAHVYVPLYDEIMEEKENRRRYARQYSKEKTITEQKPFKFHIREEEKKKSRRAQSAPLSNLANEDKAPKENFRARPFPEHLFSDTAMDRLQEEEEYRKIRKQMRSAELIRSSSLPSNMKARGEDYVRGKSRQKTQAERAKRAGITVEHKFKPKINDEVPDFDEIHRKFHSKMSTKKYAKEATVCKPFNLRTERIPSSKHKVYEDIENDEQTLRENRWPFSGSRARPFTRSAEWAYGTMSSSMDSIPAKLTTSAALRQSSSKGKLQRQIDRELAELEKERRKKLREKELKKEISKKASANDQTSGLRKSTEQKLREHREAERERLIEYKRELKRMYENVQSRPLLFEQTIQKNAQQRAERKYNETLKRAGLDEDFVSTKGHFATTGEDTGLSDDEEDSYSYQVSHHSSVRSGHSSPRSITKSYTEDFDNTDGNKTDEEKSIQEVVEDFE